MLKRICPDLEGKTIEGVWSWEKHSEEFVIVKLNDGSFIYFQGENQGDDNGVLMFDGTPPTLSEKHLDVLSLWGTTTRNHHDHI